MNETTLTIIGNLTDAPEMKFTPSGVALPRFTVASTPRTYDKASGQYKDGDPLHLALTAWRVACGMAAGGFAVPSPPASGAPLGSVTTIRLTPFGCRSSGSRRCSRRRTSGPTTSWGASAGSSGPPRARPRRGRGWTAAPPGGGGVDRLSGIPPPP